MISVNMIVILHLVGTDFCDLFFYLLLFLHLELLKIKKEVLNAYQKYLLTRENGKETNKRYSLYYNVVYSLDYNVVYNLKSNQDYKVV